MAALRTTLAVVALWLGPTTVANALEFRSVAATAAVLYDAPTTSAKKLFVLRRYAPVELVFRAGEWARVRDAEGSLSWLEQRLLSSERTVVSIASRAELYSQPGSDATVVAYADKWTAFFMLRQVDNGWVMLKHPSGLIAYAKSAQFWGL